MKALSDLLTRIRLRFSRPARHAQSGNVVLPVRRPRRVEPQGEVAGNPRSSGHASVAVLSQVASDSGLEDGNGSGKEWSLVPATPEPPTQGVAALEEVAAEPVASESVTVFESPKEPLPELTAADEDDGSRATWPSAVDPELAAATLPERCKLIRTLAALGDRWCVSILAEAMAEETSPAPRIAVLQSIAASRLHEASSIVEQCLFGEDESERLLAVKAFSALSEHKWLELALSDESIDVAMVAVRELSLALGVDEVTNVLRSRVDAERAAALESILRAA